MKIQHIVALGILCFACTQFQPASEGAREPSATPADKCTYAAMVENGEDDNGQTLVREGRGGYIYTYADDKGTTVKPRGDFSLSSGGANGSRYSLRMQGALADADGSYAGVGFSLVDPKAPYDGSRYTGIEFFAKKSPDSVSGLRFKVPDKNTDPDAGACTECYNDFGISFRLTDEWTRYVVAFDDLKQESGWGQPRPKAIDTSTMYGFQWQVNSRNAHYDVWIDDISFVGCPSQ